MFKLILTLPTSTDALRLHRSHSPYSGAKQVRHGHQSQNREAAWPRSAQSPIARADEVLEQTNFYCTTRVRFWHKADITIEQNHVCFRR